jgi:hypothetical protein
MKVRGRVEWCPGRVRNCAPHGSQPHPSGAAWSVFVGPGPSTRPNSGCGVRGEVKPMEATRESTSMDDATKNCEQCGASFPTWDALERHQNLAHPDRPEAPAEPVRRPRGDAPETPSGRNLRPDEAEMSDQRARPASPQPPAQDDMRGPRGGSEPERQAPHAPQPPPRVPGSEDRRGVEDRPRGTAPHDVARDQRGPTTEPREENTADEGERPEGATPEDREPARKAADRRGGPGSSRDGTTKAE